MEGTAQEDSTYSLQVLLAIPPAIGSEGAFKFLVSGRDHLMMEVPVTSVLRDDRFKGLTIQTQLKLGTQVHIPHQTQYTYHSTQNQMCGQTQAFSSLQVDLLLKNNYTALFTV